MVIVCQVRVGSGIKKVTCHFAWQPYILKSPKMLHLIKLMLLSNIDLALNRLKIHARILIDLLNKNRLIQNYYFNTDII